MPAQKKPNPLVRRRRRETVYLIPGVDGDRIEQLENRLDALLAQPKRTAAEQREVKKLVDERNTILEGAQDDRIKVVLEEPLYRGYEAADGTTVLGYADLQEQHPPRKGNKLDAQLGFDSDAYPPALVRLCLVEPEVTDEQWAEFVPGAGPDAASAFDWRRLTEAAAKLTNREPVLPKPLPVSALLPTNDDE
ncbi:hypothetical protein GCM10009737_08330 [Nocardioides lentus]|uniref:Tail assembly chaperone n=1 Tax=Nocardioides lentus TaxID=338077 RepID=A0ABN2P1K0_9ACTN